MKTLTAKELKKFQTSGPVGSGTTSSEALSQLDNCFTEERHIFIVDWSDVVQTSQSKSE